VRAPRPARPRRTHHAVHGAELFKLVLLVLVKEVDHVLQVVVARRRADVRERLLESGVLCLRLHEHAAVLGHFELPLADLLAQLVVLFVREQPRAAREHRLPLLVRLVDRGRVERPLALPLELVELELLRQLAHLLLRAVARVVAVVNVLTEVCARQGRGGACVSALPPGRCRAPPRADRRSPTARARGRARGRARARAHPQSSP